MAGRELLGVELPDLAGQGLPYPCFRHGPWVGPMPTDRDMAGGQAHDAPTGAWEVACGWGGTASTGVGDVGSIAWCPGSAGS